MSDAEIFAGADRTILLVCDHASAAVPDALSLGVAPALMARHIAYDIGAAALTRVTAGQLGVPAVLGTVSRLVIDLHRPPDHPQLVPEVSDGVAIPGNVGADRAQRIRRFHRPYHRAIDAAIRAQSPQLVIAIHSFTPQLADGAPRPWPVGILYNRDDRAARLAIEGLRAEGLNVGDNQPYSGRDLNMTLNRHAEARGVPSCSIEVRQDLIADESGVAAWAGRLAPLIGTIRDALAR